MSAPLPPVPENVFLWATQRPHELRAYLDAVRRLSQLEIVTVQDGVARRFPLLEAERNAVIRIELPPAA